MTARASMFAWTCAVLCAVLAPARAQVVVTEVRPQQAYFGQEVRYYVQAQGTKTAACEVPDVDGLRFELEDEGITNQSTQVTIINGRRQVVESANYTFVFRVTAARAGRFEIPPPRVTVEGRALNARGSTLVVEDPARDDRAAIEFHAEPPAVVLGQDGALVVDVFLKHLPAALNVRDPLGVYDQPGSFSLFDQGTPPPVLSLPWVADPPQGLGPIDLEGWVRSRQTRGGFQLAGVRGGRFLESGQTTDVERESADGSLARYRRYRFTFPIRGEVAGTYELPPVTLEGRLVSPQGNRHVWRDGFARSEPLRFEVLEPPLDGRPASFSGAVGSFTFEMEPPTPTLVPLGDAVYVTLVARGKGFLKGVGFDLGAQLGDQFRVERVGVTDSLAPGAERPPGFPDRSGPWRQWDFKVFPMSADVDRLPELAFSWFDPARREYATAATAAVPITVKPAIRGTSDVVVPRTSTRRETELVATSALSANVTDLNLLVDQSPNPTAWFAALVALPLLYLSLALFVRRHRRLHEDPALLRRHRAASRAGARMRAARQEGGGRALSESYVALKGFVADLTDRDEDALTSDELARYFEERGVDPALRAKVRELGEAVEAAAYGGGSTGGGADEHALLDGLERVFRGIGRAGIALLLTVGLCASALEAQDVPAFQAAQAAFDAGDFTGAAHGYERMLEGGADGAGYENGYVLYDLGNAWLRAGELGRAIAAYRRASLLIPNDANLEVNLRRALDARVRPLSPPDGRGVLDYLMFWRRSLPFRTELRLAVAAGVLAFGLGVLRLFARAPRSGLKWCALALAGVSVLLAASALLDYRVLTARDHAVVVVDDTYLRIGPGETFERRYEQPLGEGVELEVRGRRDGWLQVLAGGEYEGWLPESSAATW